LWAVSLLEIDGGARWLQKKEYEKKELAVALMKERDPNSEIDNLDELLDLLKANNGYCSDKQSV
jgi:hypothetical protein